MKVSIVIPTRNGGAILEHVLRAIAAQSERDHELICVDSGSSDQELRRLRELGARVESIPPASFDHGLARDHGARLATGEALVFLNQDALPADEQWLERLVAPLWGSDPPAAVQGAIRELEPAMSERLGRRRFFWDSCGPRFYFTRESEGWIARHDGIGFSTVNCALARAAWAALPFGPAPILEDKKWQQRATARGWRIGVAADAVVFHTHDYDLRALARRCASEGFGWRLVGERYSWRMALDDLAVTAVWAEWRAGLRSRTMRRPAEILFPLVRPLALWWGNRWARTVRS